MDIVKVDALGLACPLPVVKTIKALEALTGPATVETHVDNETAVQNVTRLAQGKGFPVRSQKLAEHHFVIAMDACKAAEKAEQTEEAPAACVPDRRGNTVAAIGTDAMGHGSEELGRQLMKGFLYALSQLEDQAKVLHPKKPRDWRRQRRSIPRTLTRWRSGITRERCLKISFLYIVLKAK